MASDRTFPTKGPHFAVVPHKLVRDPELNAHDVALYTLLKSYADFASPGVRSVGGAEPGARRLARQGNMSRNTVLKARDRLEEAGWLSYLRRDHQPPLYFLHNERLTEEEKDEWDQASLRLRQAWEEGGVEALRGELERFE